MTMPLPISQTRAPWRNLIESHIEKAKGYYFSVATVGYDSNGNPVPRVRTCGFRGFFPELELHTSGQKDLDKQVEDGGNPILFESDMLTFTTDVRMEKLGQLESTDDNIEAMFWLEEVMVQWRIKGKAYTIGSPDPDSEREGPLRMELFEALRVKEDYSGDLSGDADRWTWENAVTKYFANHSPFMRGKFYIPLLLAVFLFGTPFIWPLPSVLVALLSMTFFTCCCLDSGHHCFFAALFSPPLPIVFPIQLMPFSGSFRNPPPGQPRSQQPSNPDLRLNQKVTDLHDPVARENFRVVLILPEEVESLDLSDLDDVRRRKWTLIKDEDESMDGSEPPDRQWEETELWP